MPKRKKRYIKSLYGGIMLVRAKCPDCDRVSIVLDGKYQCCDGQIEDMDTEVVKRMCETDSKRKYLDSEAKKEILESQDYKCLYCECDLENSWYIKKKMKNPRRIVIHFDHMIPWAFTRETNRHGMVAACNICNHLKGSKYFENEIEAREYILAKRKERGIQLL